MRRELVRLGIVLGILLVAFAATVVVMNLTLTSAGGFVRGYLDALARHDVAGALQLAGPLGSADDASDELLTAEALGDLDDIELVGDVDAGDGIHHVTYRYVAGGLAGESTFEVRRTGTLLAFFPTWSFTVPPVSVLEVTPLHDTRFSANGVDVTAPAQDEPAPYLVFTPSTTRLSHESTYLQADPVDALASVPGAAVDASVDVRPTGAFVKQVQSELDAYLDECTTQEVLLPTGCPFGQEIANRIVSTPLWSMTQYPQVTIVPGPEPATWLMPRTPAAAHLVVDVRSLFDGTVTTFDEDVPFTASYLITFLPNDELLITAQY